MRIFIMWLKAEGRKFQQCINPSLVLLLTTVVQVSRKDRNNLRFIPGSWQDDQMGNLWKISSPSSGNDGHSLALLARLTSLH